MRVEQINRKAKRVKHQEIDGCRTATPQELTFYELLHRGKSMNQEIGSVIKHHRKRLGLTLIQLQDRSGINNGNLSKIERGQQSVTNDSLKAIAKGLGMSLSNLFSANQSQIAELGQNGDKKSHEHKFVGDFETIGQIPEDEFVQLPSITTSIDAIKGGIKIEQDHEHAHLFLGSAFKGIVTKNLGALVVHVVGDDTMEPRLFEGDVVAIDMGDTTIPATGGVFCVVLSDMTIEFRRLMPYPGNSLRIMCDNPKYPEAVLDARQSHGIHIVGRVKMVRSTAGL
jgi:phage repressor protein C with HTH and peptisase S24 domain